MTKHKEAEIRRCRDCKKLRNGGSYVFKFCYELTNWEYNVKPCSKYKRKWWKLWRPA